MKQKILSKIPLVGTGQIVNGEKFQVQNPATGEKLEVFTEADSNQVDEDMSGETKTFEVVRTFEATASVGAAAIDRFCIINFQILRQAQFPEALQDQNPNRMLSIINKIFTTENV